MTPEDLLRHAPLALSELNLTPGRTTIRRGHICRHCGPEVDGQFGKRNGLNFEESLEDILYEVNSKFDPALAFDTDIQPEEDPDPTCASCLWADEVIEAEISLTNFQILRYLTRRLRHLSHIQDHQDEDLKRYEQPTGGLGVAALKCADCGSHELRKITQSRLSIHLMIYTPPVTTDHHKCPKCGGTDKADHFYSAHQQIPILARRIEIMRSASQDFEDVITWLRAYPHILGLDASDIDKLEHLYTYGDTEDE